MLNQTLAKILSFPQAVKVDRTESVNNPSLTASLKNRPAPGQMFFDLLFPFHPTSPPILTLFTPFKKRKSPFLDN
jgi:hypothetical protein